MYQVIRFSLFIASSIFHELVLNMLRYITQMLPGRFMLSVACECQDGRQAFAFPCSI